jgi:pantoate--beta-alanine ligase
MRIIRSAAAMQRVALKWRRSGTRVAFVPTMGCLHDGHLALMERARRSVGSGGIVVASVYVNPTQFGPKEDFSKYPRVLMQDAALCRGVGVDVLFAPADREMYPAPGTEGFSTFVVEETLSAVMEGVARPTHFRGVTTVVAKLFNLVLPELAVFGAKDFQQAAIIRRMTRDLNFPVKILVAPTVRERDGLAMSSRNRYLTPEERRQAPVLFQALRRAATAVGNSPGGLAPAALRRDLISFIGRQPLARVDHVEMFDPVTLQPVERVRRGTRVALAVFFGNTRLIDNARL